MCQANIFLGWKGKVFVIGNWTIVNVFQTINRKILKTFVIVTLLLEKNIERSYKRLNEFNLFLLWFQSMFMQCSLVKVSTNVKEEYLNKPYTKWFKLDEKTKWIFSFHWIFPFPFKYFYLCSPGMSIIPNRSQ